MPKRYSLKAVKRQCPECGKVFRPMTDKLWEWNFRAHRLLSIRRKHKQ